MPILESIRLGTDNAFMKLVFGAIVLVFVFWGVGATQGPTSQIVAEVNGQRLTDTEFQREMRYRTRSAGGSLNENEVSDLARQVLQEQIQQKALVLEAQRLNIVVSTTEVARIIKKYDAFKGQDGKFSTELFDRSLKRQGMTRARFEEQIRNERVLNKLFGLVATSVQVTPSQVRQAFDAQRTKIILEATLIPDDALLTYVEVDPTEIDGFFETAEEEVKAAYEAERDTVYTKSAKANISTIVLRTDVDVEGDLDQSATAQTRMEAILQEARDGADFAELAREHSHDLSATNGGALGTMAQKNMDPAIARIVFAPEASTAPYITDIVQTGQGFQIIKVHDIVPEMVTPYDEVKRTIAHKILAKDEVAAFGDKIATDILNAWNSADAPPVDMLDRFGLQVLPVGPMSPAKPELGIYSIGALASTLPGLAQTGLINQVFSQPGQRVLASVKSIDIPSGDDFSAAEPLLRAQLEQTAQGQFIEAYVDNVVERAQVIQYYQP